MDEATKAAKRRKNDPRFEKRWFVGKMLDVGCGKDPVKSEDWENLSEVVGYDRILGNKDGQFLPEVEAETYDVVHASHCLEHLQDTRVSLTNWLRVLRPGGFVVATVPEEFYYECGRWPSRWNGDHKRSFSMRYLPVIASSTNILNLLWKIPAELEHLTLLTDGWSIDRFGTDQTMSEAECAIEFVLRKPHPQRIW